MINRRSLRTILLLVVVSVLVFCLFVALPGIVPAFDTADLDTVIWSCSLRGQPPLKYDTWIWNEPTMPEDQRGSKMDVIGNPGMKNSYNVSGYLHYGQFLKPEDDEAASFIMPKCNQLGVMKNTGMVMEIKQVYKDRAVSETLEFKTDAHGRFDERIMIDAESECFRVTVTYAGDIIEPKNLSRPVEIYFGCEEAYTDCSPIQLQRIDRGVPWWLLLTGAILFIALIGAGYWYVKSRVRFAETLDGIDELDDTKVPESEEEVPSGGDTELIEIVFPEIMENLPLVWGVNERLEVNVRAVEAVDVSQIIYIDWGDGTFEHHQPDTTGIAKLAHTYGREGMYTITIGYRSLSGKDVSSWRKIRIVHYREEIVRLFDEMVSLFNIADTVVEPAMTPREVEKLLIYTVPGVSVSTVMQVVLIFEEANYSTHRTGREHYVAMYRAIQEVLQHDR